MGHHFQRKNKTLTYCVLNLLAKVQFLVKAVYYSVLFIAMANAPFLVQGVLTFTSTDLLIGTLRC